MSTAKPEDQKKGQKADGRRDGELLEELSGGALPRTLKLGTQKREGEVLNEKGMNTE